ncbi:inositol polyphosphate kinase-domain-containing protein [Dipodascopsis uninucleata]
MQIDLSDAISLDSKVAGHDGVLQDASGALVIKPAVPAEIEFYETLPLHPEFSACAPRMYGKLEMAATQNSVDLTKDAKSAIVIENVTAGFRKPSIIDVKLGRQLWDENAPEEKRKRLDEVAAVTTSGSLAMRIAGMKVWEPSKQEYLIYDKNYGRIFSAENVITGIGAFVPASVKSEQRMDIIKRIIGGLQKIQDAFEIEECRMYSASILIVYEGDGNAYDEGLLEEEKSNDNTKEEEEEEEELQEADIITETPICRVKLIDFAHASWTPGHGKDANSLEGVINLKRLFTEVIQKL